MKKKDFYELTIKIVGIIAAWKFIESLMAYASFLIAYLSMSAQISMGMVGIAQPNFSIFYLFTIAMYGLFGYLFLFMTDKILKLLRLTDADEATLQVERKTAYHIAVLAIGFFMLTYSGSRLISNNQSKTEQTTTQQTSSIQGHAFGPDRTTVTTTVSSPKVSMAANFTNILILILSMLMILKSEKCADLLQPKAKEELAE